MSGVDPALVERFKSAWHEADDLGDVGHRVEAGLDAVADDIARAERERVLAEVEAWLGSATRRALVSRLDLSQHSTPETETCDHDWMVEYVPDPGSFGGVLPSGDVYCRDCGARERS